MNIPWWAHRMTYEQWLVLKEKVDARLAARVPWVPPPPRRRVDVSDDAFADIDSGIAALDKRRFEDWQLEEYEIEKGGF